MRCVFRKYGDDACEPVGSSWCEIFCRTVRIRTAFHRCVLPKNEKSIITLIHCSKVRFTYKVSGQIRFLEECHWTFAAFVWFVSRVNNDMASNAASFELLLAYGTLDSPLLDSGYDSLSSGRFRLCRANNRFILRLSRHLDIGFFIIIIFMISWLLFDFRLSLSLWRIRRFVCYLLRLRRCWEVGWRVSLVKASIVTVEIILFPKEVIANFTSESTHDTTWAWLLLERLHGGWMFHCAAMLLFVQLILGSFHHEFSSFHVTAIHLKGFLEIRDRFFPLVFMIESKSFSVKRVNVVGIFFKHFIEDFMCFRNFLPRVN